MVLFLLSFAKIPVAVFNSTGPTDNMEFVVKLRAVITKLWATADSNHDGNWTKVDIESLFTIYDLNREHEVSFL